MRIPFRIPKHVHQLPSRVRLGCPNAVDAFDESIAALRVVASHGSAPRYLIRDLQWAAVRLGLRNRGTAYLKHMADKAREANGNILECGSGLSTLLLAITMRRRGQHIHAFEHNPDRQRHLHSLIQRYQLQNVTVHATSIISYGDFDWYALPKHRLDPAFSLVICDGPARHLTDSGRYGLFPVMRGYLDSYCTVIMDDSHHCLDRRVIRRWRREQRIRVQSFGTFPQFAEITRG